MILFFISGIVLVAFAAVLPRLGDLGSKAHLLLYLWAIAHAAYLLAAYRALRAPAGAASKRALGWILGMALLARLLLIPAAPTLSEDAYRYLWDGSLTRDGINPFVHAPSDPALAERRNDLFARLNHADVPTIYPPAAQLFFGAVASVRATPAALKAAYLPIEIAAWIALLALLRRRGLAPERILLFAWNPLVLVESYGSGHVDLLAAAALVVAIALLEAGRRVPAGVAWAIAALSKYTPLLLGPTLVRKRAWALLLSAALTMALLTLPFLGAGRTLFLGLGAYTAHWEFNGPLFPLFRAVLGSGDAARLLLAALLVVAVTAISIRARTVSGAALACLTAYLIASPTVFPWYLVPLAALLPLHPDAGLLAATGLVALTYLPLPHFRATGEWTLPSWIPWIEYGVWALVALAAWLRTRAAATPAGSQERREAWATESPPT
ncbi:MAG TPA: glycosyltransferase 87 family protein [Candidatus Eisenbacteria bacterium]|nr:glycosyltransferase 87 family protein [Candidatus Eisenbacteria bacterium]